MRDGVLSSWGSGSSSNISSSIDYEKLFEALGIQVNYYKEMANFYGSGGSIESRARLGYLVKEESSRIYERHKDALRTSLTHQVQQDGCSIRWSGCQSKLQQSLLDQLEKLAELERLNRENPNL